MFRRRRALGSLPPAPLGLAARMDGQGAGRTSISPNRSVKIIQMCRSHRKLEIQNIDSLLDDLFIMVFITDVEIIEQLSATIVGALI